MKFNRLYGGLLIAATLFIGTSSFAAPPPVDHAIPKFGTAALANDSTELLAPDLIQTPNETSCLIDTLRLERPANPIVYMEPNYFRPPIPTGISPVIDQPPLANVAAPSTSRYFAAVDCMFKHR